MSATLVECCCLLAGGFAYEIRRLRDAPPPGGWENVDYPKGTGENLEHYPPPPKGDDDEKDDEPEFTSRYHITAVGAEVRNGTVSVPGPADAVGYYNYGINSKTERICWVSHFQRTRLITKTNKAVRKSRFSM